MRKLFAWTVLFPLATGAWAAPPTKRVAVLDFDYATVHSGVAAIFGSNADIGKGVADLLVEKLVTSGTYSVVERKAIAKILAEQNLANSDRVDTATAVKLGRILGVQAVIVGSVTQFGRDDKATSVGGLGSFTGRYGLGRVGVRESKAVVGLSARIISTETAQILAVASGKGQATRSGTSLLGSGGTSVNLGGGEYDMTSQNFAGTIIGEATHEAVASLASQVDQQAVRVPETAIQIDGLVADVSGETLILNVGSRAGVKVGDRLAIRRPAREIRDPATGSLLRRIVEPVGECIVTDVDEVSSVAKFSGAATPQVGDSVGAPVR